MPTYEYTCKNCGNNLEQFQSITSKPIKKCPKCNKLTLKRLISSGAGIIFKGSGFYQTDYRSDSYKSAVKSEKSTSSTAPAKTESKTETKTETKSESKPAKPKSASK